MSHPKSTSLKTCLSPVSQKCTQHPPRANFQHPFPLTFLWHISLFVRITHYPAEFNGVSHVGQTPLGGHWLWQLGGVFICLTIVTHPSENQLSLCAHTDSSGSLRRVLSPPRDVGYTPLLEHKAGTLCQEQRTLH